MNTITILNRLAFKASFSPRVTHTSVNFRLSLVRYQSSLIGLPFKMTRQQAGANFVKHKGFLEASSGPNSSALTLFQSDPIKTCYLPFHSADIRHVNSSYVGQYGKDRIECYFDTEYDGKHMHQVMRTRTVTDWYPCSGTLDHIDYPFGTRSTQIYAGFVYPQAIVEKVLR